VIKYIQEQVLVLQRSFCALQGVNKTVTRWCESTQCRPRWGKGECFWKWLFFKVRRLLLLYICLSSMQSRTM